MFLASSGAEHAALTLRLLRITPRSNETQCTSVTVYRVEASPSLGYSAAHQVAMGVKVV